MSRTAPGACGSKSWASKRGATRSFQDNLVVVENSATVVIARSALNAASALAAPVVELRDSSTFLFDTTVSGGEDQTLIHLEDGFLGMYGGTLADCGFYCTAGRPLHLTGTSPLAELQSV